MICCCRTTIKLSGLQVHIHAEEAPRRGYVCFYPLTETGLPLCHPSGCIPVVFLNSLYLYLSCYLGPETLAWLFLEGWPCLSRLSGLMLWYSVVWYSEAHLLIFNWLIALHKGMSREQSPSQNFLISHFQLFAIKTHRCTSSHPSNYPPPSLWHFKTCLAKEKSYPCM